MYPNIDKMLDKVDSRFTLSILAAKRARQINDYMNNVKRQPLGEIRGPAFDMLSEKPLSIAFSEIGNGQISYKRTKDGIK